MFIDLPMQGCTDGDIRLIGREAESSGQVEVCVLGSWGPVCGFGWDENEANVVCQQLNRTLGLFMQAVEKPSRLDSSS